MPENLNLHQGAPDKLTDGVDMPDFEIVLHLPPPIVRLVRHVWSDKAEFSFLQKKTAF